MLVLAAVTFGFCGFVSLIVAAPRLVHLMSDWKGLLGMGPTCPKCETINRIRISKKLEPLPRADLVVRADGATYCERCGEATYPEAVREGTRYEGKDVVQVVERVTKYDPRFHKPDKAA